ncbi:Kiwa anti-phage protein KwaB-like domain-containing protein [Plesiomonas shigelloides]|uniref:Kiwa anti-phage protein KwaB-like domain-containing protein n=1 Tax=Plesiomonas shigelloides TaxID=703 RepID=UPI003260376F
MPAKKKLSEIIEIIHSESVTFKLFFITRHVKDGVGKNDKVIDKYTFKANSIDMSSDVCDFFKNNSKTQLEKLTKIDGYDLESYNVITDDLGNKLYTYALNNTLSFSDVIFDQLLTNNIGSITSLKEIKKDLWAYCLKVTNSNNQAYLFRKMSSGKVTTDEPQNKKEKISSWFDSNDSELKVINSETVSFDDKLDCIYFNSEFLVIRKSGFEQIVGLEEEFLTVANDVISVIESTNLVVGVEHIKLNLGKSRALMKTLANIGKKGNHSEFNSDEITKMKDALKRFEGKELKVSKDGKLVLENSVDVGYFVKLLNDYYKMGVITGKFYGTNSGSVIEVA